VAAKIAADGVLGPDARAHVVQRCAHCGTIWAIQIYPLEGAAKAEVEGLIDEAKKNGTGGLH
jgi:hypothetical protein